MGCLPAISGLLFLPEDCNRRWGTFNGCRFGMVTKNYVQAMKSGLGDKLHGSSRK